MAVSRLRTAYLDASPPSTQAALLDCLALQHMNINQLTLTAYHEAGHAVVSAVLGFDVKKVTIVSDEDSVGHMLPRGYLQLRRLDWEVPTGARLGRYHDYVLVLLAGTEAVHHFNPRGVRSHHLDHKDSDYRRVLEILLKLHGRDEPERFAAFRYLRIRARNLVNREINWVKIEGLAKALLERQTLSR